MERCKIDSVRRIRDRVTLWILALAVILLAAFASMNVVAVVKMMMFPNRLASTFGRAIVLSGTDAPEPAIGRGDLVHVSTKEPNRVGVGDLVIFCPSRFVICPILASEPTESGGISVTVGHTPDGSPITIPAADIQGRVTGSSRFWGRIIGFSQTMVGAIIFVGVPLGLFVGYALIFDRQRRGNKPAKIQQTEE
ncbi:MAG: hypothetical protein LBN02_09385 [Oscillospiraceae bacterium]|jgi:hypothetical protein|nr:hypothetical protein [Oscillospiraceae bacterium]